jgi:hypothetical protein
MGYSTKAEYLVSNSLAVQMFLVLFLKRTKHSTHKIAGASPRAPVALRGFPGGVKTHLI